MSTGFFARYRTEDRTYNFTEGELYVLSVCDGQHDFSSPAFLPSHRAVLDSLIRKGVAKRVPRGFSGEFPDIHGVLWAVTGKCNLRCRHCYMSAPEGQTELSYKDMLVILDRLCEAGALSIRITGGEPLMRRDLFELLEEISSRGLEVEEIYTNGTLVDDCFLSSLSQTGLHPLFRISFDGVGTHDIMRGIVGTQERTIAGICRLLDAGYKVTVSTSVDSRTICSLSATYELLCSLPIRAWGIGRPLPAGCGKDMNRVSNQEFADVCKEVKRRWEADGKPFTLGLESFFSETVTEDMFRIVPPMSIDSYACGSCRSFPHITNEGFLMPCPCYADTPYASSMPNLVESGWKEAWSNPVYRHIMDITRREIISANPECGVCPSLNECRTGCRISAVLGGTGLLGRDENTCSVFKGGFREHFNSIDRTGV